MGLIPNWVRNFADEDAKLITQRERILTYQVSTCVEFPDSVQTSELIVLKFFSDHLMQEDSGLIRGTYVEFFVVALHRKIEVDQGFTILGTLWGACLCDNVAGAKLLNACLVAVLLCESHTLGIVWRRVWLGWFVCNLYESISVFSLLLNSTMGRLNFSLYAILIVCFIFLRELRIQTSAHQVKWRN